MSDQWYVEKAGAWTGPYSWEELRALAGGGKLAAGDAVRRGEEGATAPADQVTGLLDAAPTPVARADGEKIEGMIPAVRRKTGLLSSKVYNLVVTDRRIVFAETTKEMLKQAASDAAQEAKEQGKGLLGRMATTMVSSRRVYEKYWQMDIDAILKETSGNFAVPLNEIKKISFYVHTVHVRVEQQNMGRTGKDQMTIKTNQEKIKLTFEPLFAASSKQADEARALLRRVLGKNKVG